MSKLAEVLWTKSWEMKFNVEIKNWIIILDFFWDFHNVILSRVWSFIRVKDNFIIKITNEFSEDAFGHSWKDSNRYIEVYNETNNWLIKIDWVLPFMVSAWVTKEDIFEAIKISIENPFIEWEKTIESWKKQVNWVLGS
jgi:hypothetical protein